MKIDTMLLKQIIKYDSALERLEQGRNSITLRLNDDNGETKQLLKEFFTVKRTSAIEDLRKMMKLKV